MAIVLTLLSPITRAETPTAIQMKLLVISADGNEPSFAAIQAVLQQLGVPYDTMIATKTTLTATTLSTGTGTGHYQGILLATGNLGYQDSSGNFPSAFTTAEWQTLWQYESLYKVRQVTLYTYPAGAPDNYGLNLVKSTDTTSTPLKVTLSSTGKQIFNYLNPTSPVTITNAWTYLATPASPTNPVPLLSTADGYAVASVYSYSDGRQNLTITADEAPYLIHSQELGYGIVNWVSKGMFLGERKTYLSAQVDDVLIDDDMWDVNAQSDATGITFRMSGQDYKALVSWQSKLNSSTANASQVLLELGFNGVGTTGIYTPDTLTPAIRSGQGSFRWLSHTYDHENLDQISYSDAKAELQNNQNVAVKLGFKQYYKDSLIQPDVSGLGNPNFLQAAYDFGLRYILSDTSVAGGNNPSPNAGQYSTYQPSILVVPRRPTNLYYNVSTPTEWASEYNHFYAPGGLFPTWDHALSYTEVLDKESQIMLSYMLNYSIDPLMFHQPNLRAYDGTHSTLGDLIAATMAKYNALFNLPVRSLAHHDIGVAMANRMAYNASGVTGTLMLGSKNNIVLQTSKAATIPLTGIGYGSNQETYGGQSISRFSLSANGSTTIPAPAW